MCGIVGVVGHKDPVSVLVAGLKRLEYRGYDSAGVATVGADGLKRCRAEGKIAALEQALEKTPVIGSVGIGHTRWATHGEPSDSNAHPHGTKRMMLVHNGIIENYQDLKQQLEADGHAFESETDSEVFARLIDDYLEEGLDSAGAVKAAIRRVKGAYAIAVLFAGQDDLIVAARQGSPLVVGYGKDQNFIASDVLAIAEHTDRVTYLDDGDIAIVTSGQVTITDIEGTPVKRPIEANAATAAMIGKGRFRHFMHKEIHEQPEVVTYTLKSVIDYQTGRLALPKLDVDLSAVEEVDITACGTAALAGHVARYWIERLARVPVDVDIASEFRYREPPLRAGTICVTVSQSGETADTLAALDLFKSRNTPTIAIVNQPQSTMAREAQAVLKTLAGPEIGVASTKAFTTQLVVLAGLALGIAKARKTLTEEAELAHCKALLELPARMADVLARENEILTMAQAISQARDVLYLGRGPSYPLALEGALKLKEISYIHAEGYAAGELKHGPIALIDESVPVVVIAPSDHLFDKTLSNIQQVRARGGRVFLFTDREGAAAAGGDAEAVFIMPEIADFAAPILYALPVQLLAYHTAVLKGTDVDQPRNLAKSVTVE